MKALVGAFNQARRPLVWAFSVIVKTDGSLYLLLPARTQSCHAGGLGEEREESAELVAEMDTKIRELTEAVTCKDQELERLKETVRISAANRLIGEVVQSRRRPLLGPSPG